MNAIESNCFDGIQSNEDCMRPPKLIFSLCQWSILHKTVECYVQIIKIIDKSHRLHLKICRQTKIDFVIHESFERLRKFHSFNLFCVCAFFFVVGVVISALQMIMGSMTFDTSSALLLTPIRTFGQQNTILYQYQFNQV